ncbi:MAG: DUF1893 domain-containing protein [Paludibacteraceae bacterium]|nr:DUF1893 domain-containing protein [Paludibacteraceae bacterium]
MKKLFFTLLVGLVMMACTGRQPQGAKMLQQLNEQQVSLLVYNNDSLSDYHQRGTRDLLMLVQNEPERLKGAIVADKMIGKAAAALMVLGGVKEVHTNTICTPAKQMLQEAGIPIFFTNEVPYIINRAKTGQCPLDSRLSEVTNATECLPIIADFYTQLDAGQVAL